jgi:hypothetical protein
MPIIGTPEQRKKQVFHEFKQGVLHSGRPRKSGKPAPLVKKRKQAIAIALSEAGEGRRKK